MPRPYVLEHDIPLIGLVGLAGLHEVACSIAEREYDLRGDIPPCFMFMDARTNTCGRVAVPWENDRQKVQAFDVVREMLAMQPAIAAYTFICEVWAKIETAPKGVDRKEWARKRKERSLANDPDAESLLMIQSASRAGKSKITNYKVMDKPGLKKKLSIRVDLPDDQAAEYTGRAFNFFQPEREL